MTPMTPFYNISIKRGRNGERVKTPAYMEKLVIVSLGVMRPTMLRKSHDQSNIHTMQAFIDIFIGLAEFAAVWAVWYAALRVAGR